MAFFIFDFPLSNFDRPYSSVRAVQTTFAKILAPSETSEAWLCRIEMNRYIAGAIYDRSGDHLCICVARWRSNYAATRAGVLSSRSGLYLQFAAESAHIREHERL